MATAGEEIFMVDNYNRVDRQMLDVYLNLYKAGDLESLDEGEKAYIQKKQERGYSHVDHMQEPTDLIFGVELKSLDPQNVTAKTVQGMPSISFTKDWPGIGEKRHTIYFVNADITRPETYPSLLRDKLNKKEVNGYFQNAGMHISEKYEDFIPQIVNGFKEGKGFLVTDDYLGNDMTRKISVKTALKNFDVEEMHITSQGIDDWINARLRQNNMKGYGWLHSVMRIGAKEVVSNQEDQGKPPEQIDMAMSGSAEEGYSRRWFIGRMAIAAGLMASEAIPESIFGQEAKPDVTIKIFNLIDNLIDKSLGPDREEIRNNMVRLFVSNEKEREAAWENLSKVASDRNKQAIVQVLMIVLNRKGKDIFYTQAYKLLLSYKDLSGTGFNDLNVAETFLKTFNFSIYGRDVARLEDGRILFMGWLNERRSVEVFDMLTANWLSFANEVQNQIVQSLTEDVQPVLSLAVRTAWARTIQNQLDGKKINEYEAFRILRSLFRDQPEKLKNNFTEAIAGKQEEEFFSAFVQSGLLISQQDYEQNRPSLVAEAKKLFQAEFVVSKQGKREEIRHGIKN